jgi:hypothetical protein
MKVGEDLKQIPEGLILFFVFKIISVIWKNSTLILS